MTWKRLIAWACVAALLLAVVFVFVKARHRGSRVYPRYAAAQMEQSLRSPNIQQRPAGNVATNRVSTSHVAKKRELSWKMPQLDGVDANDSAVVELTINDDGSRVLAKSKRQVCLFETGSTNAIKSFAAAGVDQIFVSPDTRAVAIRVQGEAGKPARVLFQDAATGKKLSAPELERDVEVEWEMVSFSSDGRELLLPGHFHDGYVVQSIPVESGLKKMVELPVFAGVKGRLQILQAIPGRQAYVACWNGDRVPDRHPSQVSVLDLENGTERPLPEIDIVPLRGICDRRVWVSRDGNLVMLSDILAKEPSGFEVADLRTGEIVRKRSENLVTFPNGCFTPDGKRVVMEWAPHFEVMYFNALPTAPQRKSERPVPKLQLYKIADGEKLAEYTPPGGARTLALSGDGKRLAFSRGTEVFVIGFREAFGVD